MGHHPVDDGPIGYYIHHHGTGHLRQALNITRHINRPVVLFSSLDEPDGLPPHVSYVALPTDVVPEYTPKADSVFHYTPYDDRIFERNRLLTDSWHSMGIRQLYVDVSIEVAVLARLHGLTVGHAVLQGNRTDKAHSYGYDACDYLLACTTPAFDTPESRSTATPVLYAGGMSRYQRRRPQPLQTCRRVAVLLSPQAERPVDRQLAALAAQLPDVEWHSIGFAVDAAPRNVISHGTVDDPLPLLEAADIVIGSGGINSIMEIASLGKPFICIPEDRPYDEQIRAAESLQRLQAAVYTAAFPSADDWPDLLRQARRLDLDAFSHLVDDDAARTAADIISRGGRF